MNTNNNRSESPERSPSPLRVKGTNPLITQQSHGEFVIPKNLNDYQTSPIKEKHHCWNGRFFKADPNKK